jgi:hypothetical protein
MRSGSGSSPGRDRARRASAAVLLHVEAVEARTDMSSGLAYGPLVSTSLFSVEGYLVRATSALSISSKVRPLVSGPNAQKPTTPRMYQDAK